MALNVILKIESNYSESFVTLDKENSAIDIYTKEKLQGEDLLRDVLSYIIPIGYDINVATYKDLDLSKSPTQLGLLTSQENIKSDTISSSVVIPNQGNSESITTRSKGGYTTTLVIKGTDSE